MKNYLKVLLINLMLLIPTYNTWATDKGCEDLILQEIKFLPFHINLGLELKKYSKNVHELLFGSYENIAKNLPKKEECDKTMAKIKGMREILTGFKIPLERPVNLVGLYPEGEFGLKLNVNGKDNFFDLSLSESKNHGQLIEGLLKHYSNMDNKNKGVFPAKVFVNNEDLILDSDIDEKYAIKGFMIFENYSKSKNVTGFCMLTKAMMESNDEFSEDHDFQDHVICSFLERVNGKHWRLFGIKMMSVYISFDGELIKK